MTSNKSLIEQDNSTSNSNTFNNTNDSLPIGHGMSQPTIPVKIKLVAGSLVGTTEYTQVYNDIGSGQNISDSARTPTLVGVALSVASCGGAKMDKKQYITYEVICSTFLLV